MVFNSSFEGQGAVEIYTIRPDGSRLRRLRREPKGSCSLHPVFSPNGERIAFVHGSRRGVPHIWTMEKNRTPAQQADPRPASQRPAGPGSPSRKRALRAPSLATC
jgi:Tol biopolymer transport system component